MYPLRHHPIQARWWMSRARFNIVPAGRRSGKTEIAKRKTVLRALAPSKFGGSPYSDPKYFLAAPTRDQAKRIYWDDLKAMVPPFLRSRPPSESHLIVYLTNNAEIQVVGMDKPERIEGTPWDGGILDEYGNMKKETWGAHVRPALSDRRGWCDMIGVPEGRNHYYKEYKRAMADTSGVRAAWHWISADILPLEEIEEAKRDLDELTYMQEYEASFINFTGRAYWPFDEYLHCAPLIHKYDNRQPLIFCFDFNVAPGSAVVAQEMKLPTKKGTEIGTGVIGEVWIPRNSNTVLVTNRLINDWKDHKGRIVCYGDSTGGARGSAKILGSDWQLIKELLYREFGPERVSFKVPKANPRERDRVNSVNSRLLSTSGTVRCMVDPHQAPNMVEDFESTVTVDGGSGEIEKKDDPERSHQTDALGYYIWKEWPVKKTYAASGRRYWK
jgi:hypothetical protein